MPMLKPPPRIFAAALALSAAAGLAAQPPATPPAPPAPASSPPAPAASPRPAPPKATEPTERKDAGAVKLFERQLAEVDAAAAQGTAQVLFLGDSITQGWLGAGKPVWDAAYAKLGAINLGVGGDRTGHLLHRIQALKLERLAKPAAGAPPKLAVVMIGTNNFGSDSPEEVAAGVRAVVDDLRTRLPTTKIILLGIFPRGAKPADPIRAKVAATNAILQKFAAPGAVEYHDIGGVFLEADGAIAPETMPDALHLSPKAYAAWAAALQGPLAGG